MGGPNTVPVLRETSTQRCVHRKRCTMFWGPAERLAVAFSRGRSIPSSSKHFLQKDIPEVLTVKYVMILGRCSAVVKKRITFDTFGRCLPSCGNRIALISRAKIQWISSADLLKMSLVMSCESFMFHVLTHHAMPRSLAVLVKVLLDVGSDVLLDVILVHRHAYPFCGFLLQILRNFCNQNLDLHDMPDKYSSRWRHYQGSSETNSQPIREHGSTWRPHSRVAVEKSFGCENVDTRK